MIFFTSFIYINGKFIGVKPQCYFVQFCVKGFYYTLNQDVLSYEVITIQRRLLGIDVKASSASSPDVSPIFY